MASPRHNALAFDGAGAPVPSVGFEYPEEAEEAAPGAAERAEILAAALRIVFRGRNARFAAHRLYALQPLLAEMIEQEPYPYREIAAINGTTPAAVSLLKDRLAEELRQELVAASHRSQA